MKKIKAVKMATGGLMSMPPYIAKQDLMVLHLMMLILLCLLEKVYLLEH
jgi:hypothetical protein